MPQTLTHEGIYTLLLIFISILGMILTQDTAGQKQNRTHGENSGQEALGLAKDRWRRQWAFITHSHSAPPPQAFLPATPGSRL